MKEANRHWSKLSESGTVMGMKLLLAAYHIFGRFSFRIILFPVMSYYYVKNSVARHASKQYLLQIGLCTPNPEHESLSSFKHFLTFGDIILDKFLVWMGKIGREDVVFETPAILDRLDASEQGGIIVVSHLGNVEVCNALGQQLKNIRLTLLVNTEHAAKFNSLMDKASGSPNIKVLQVKDISPATAMVLSERIEQGEYVVIASDRTPATGQGRVSRVNFLGKPALMPQGAFILGNILKCPVYLMFCLKEKGRYHIYVELFAKQLKFIRKQRDTALTDIVQRYANRLQYYCLKEPLQWFNFYPFWEQAVNKEEALEKN